MSSLTRDAQHTFFDADEGCFHQWFARYRVQFIDGSIVDDTDTNDLRIARAAVRRIPTAWSPRIFDMETGQVVQ